MSDSYLDHLPSQEREKIRKRLRSPEEYERLREKVKGPEDLEREMEKNAEFAEAKLHLEVDPKAREQVKSMVQEAGKEALAGKTPEWLQEALKAGNFEVTVDEHSSEPKLAVKPTVAPNDAPTGKVQEIFPLKQSLQQNIAAKLRSLR